VDRLTQRISNRSHSRIETEDQRIQDSHSQPHARFSTFFLRGTDEYRPVAARTRRPQAAAAVSPRRRRPKQFSRPRECICATRSFQLAVVVSFRFASHQSRSHATSRLRDTHHRSHASERVGQSPGGGHPMPTAPLPYEGRPRHLATMLFALESRILQTLRA
jgi:hypothetical protein